MHLRKILASKLVKYCYLNPGKILFEKKISNKSLRKIPMQTGTQHEKNACSKEK